MFRILKKSDIDVVHSNGFTAMIVSVVPTYLYKKPHFLTAHDTFTKKQFTQFKGLITKLVLGVCFRFVDVIHSVSNDAQCNLLEYFPALRKKLSKLVVIPNGVDTKSFLVDEQGRLEKTNWLRKRDIFDRFFWTFYGSEGL